ncbi:MAG: LCP family protein [Patescibacteria group bacterium]
MAHKEPAEKAKVQPVTQAPPDAKANAGALQSKKHHFHWWHTIIVVVSVIAVVTIGMGVKLIQVSGKVFGGTTDASPLDQLGRLIGAGDRQLKQDANHRTNILLAGYGGPGHDGAYLADTIIFVSIDNTTNDIATLSLPRDLLVNLPGSGYRKINNALAFGMSETNPHGGDSMLTNAVQEVTGQTVHYFAKIDFNGFKNAVDAVGGVEITVDTAFVDLEYPDNNYGYQTITFDAGKQKIDGAKALEFVRSRHGTNGEGSDFARSKRQQKLLFALREKALSLGTLTNPSKVSGLLDSLGNHVFTTFELWEVARLGTIMKELTPEKVVTRVLETTSDNLVVVGTGQDNAYVIQPRMGLGNWTEVHDLAANIFQLNIVQREAATIQVINATTKTGFAESVGHTLRGFGFDVQTVASPKGLDAIVTTVVDLSGGKAPQTVASLQQRYNAPVLTSLPTNLTLTPGKTIVNSNANGNKNVNAAVPPKVILILGTDALATVTDANRTVNQP